MWKCHKIYKKCLKIKHVKSSFTRRPHHMLVVEQVHHTRCPLTHHHQVRRGLIEPQKTQGSRLFHTIHGISTTYIYITSKQAKVYFYPTPTGFREKKSETKFCYFYFSLFYFWFSKLTQPPRFGEFPRQKLQPSPGFPHLRYSEVPGTWRWDYGWKDHSWWHCWWDESARCCCLPKLRWTGSPAETQLSGSEQLKYIK